MKRRYEAPPELPDFIIEDFNPLDEARADDVDQIIRWSVRESMVAISSLSIRGHNFAKAAYAEFDPGYKKLVGYGAITHIYSSDVVELGGLVVSEKMRGRGVASGIVRAVIDLATEKIKPDMVIAFSNKGSASTFLRLGGVQIEDAATLPPEVWKICHTCRFFDDALEAGRACCGRVFDITTVNQEEQ